MRGRALLVVAVLAVATAIGIGLVSTPVQIRSPASIETAPRSRPVPVEASMPLRPQLDVDAFEEYSSRVADQRREKAQRMLDTMYPGLAFVTVSVELDPFWERTTERVQPDVPAVLEDERPDGGSEGARRRTYDPWSGTREIGMLAPDVRRVDVALILDESIVGDRTRKAEIAAVVGKAVGLVAGRDPDVEILSGPIPTASKDSTAAASPPPEASVLVDDVISVVAWSAGIALLALVLAWFGLRRSSARSRVVAGEPAPASSADSATDVRELRREVESAIGGDPIQATRLLEGWLTEGRV